MSVKRVAMINSDQKSAPALPDPPGVETTLYDLRFRVLARTPYQHQFTELGTLEAAERAIADGVDTIYIDTVGDYALDAIRALAGVPVIGAGEESIRFAAGHPSFSIVTVWPESMGYLYAGRLSATPGGERCRGVHHLSENDELDRVARSDGVRARMSRLEGEIVDELVALCERAVAGDRSEAILLGCTCMAPVAGQVAARVPVPVLEPSQIGLNAAHAAASQVTSRPAQTRPAVTAHLGLAGELVDAYLAATDTAAVALDDCDVCAIPTTRPTTPGEHS